VKYQQLIKTSLIAISISLSLIVFALLSLNILHLLKSKMHLYTLLSLEIIFIFIIILIIVTAEILYSSSKLESLKYIKSFRTGLLIIYIYLVASTLFYSSARFLLIELPHYIPPYPALYLFTLIILLTASFLTREKSLKSAEKATFVTGLIFEFIGVIIGLVILYTIITSITGNNAWFNIFVLIAMLTAFTIYSWSRIENTIVKIRGSHTYSTLYSMIYRRIVTAILCAILALIALYYNGLFLLEGFGYKWTFMNIEETFYLLTFISLALILVGTIIGIGGVILFLPSCHGIRGFKLISQHKLSAGKGIDELLSSLGVIQPTPPPIPTPQITQPQPVTTVTQQERRIIEETRAVKKCPYCEKEIVIEAKFCPYCGAFLEGDEGTRVYTTPPKRKEESGKIQETT